MGHAGEPPSILDEGVILRPGIILTMEGQLYRITIRATDESVPPVLMKFMEDTYSMGVERD